jgi:hypothetical protein
MVDDTANEPVICVFAFSCNVPLLGVPIIFVCTDEPVTPPNTFNEPDDALNTGEPLTFSDITLALI